MTDYVARFNLEDDDSLSAEYTLEQPENLNASFDLNDDNSLSADFTLEEPENINAILKLDVAPNAERLATKEELQEAEDELNERIDGVIEDVSTKVETINGTGLIDVQRTENAVTITSKTYIHEQGVATAIWTINHNLDKYPSVTLVDTAGTVFIGKVEYIDKNNCKVTINGSTKGKAYLN